MSVDPFEACTVIASIPGITRILTSGHSAPKVPAALTTLRRLQEHIRFLGSSQAKPVPLLLPGSGISPATIAATVRSLYPAEVREYHLSAGSLEDGGVLPEARDGKDNFGMGGWGIWRTSATTVRDVRLIASQSILES